MITTTNGAKKPETSDSSSGLRTSIATNADLLEAILAIEGWHNVGAGGEPAFQNSWVAGSPTARFYKHLGRVYLQGVASHGGAASSVIFTLPAGYRPVTVSNPTACVGIDPGTGGGVEFAVNNSGNVFLAVASTSVDFAGASFRAEA